MKASFLLLCLVIFFGVMDVSKEDIPSLLNAEVSACEGQLLHSANSSTTPKKKLGLMNAQQVGRSLHIKIGFCNSCGIDSYEMSLQVVATDTINLTAKRSDDDGEIYVTLCSC